MIKKIQRIISIKRHKRAWRIKNRHNFTEALNVFEINNVSVGKGTYGKLCVGNDTNSQLIIGNYVSIGGNVIFLVGLDHPTHYISTFPFRAKILHQQVKEAISKGDIIIEDDVWLADNVTVLSGVTIGQGAVIAAGSVVTKDIPPYAIAAGVPAKVLRYRFEKDIINELRKIDFSQLDEKIIADNIEKLYQQITDINQLDWLPRKEY